MLPLLFLLACPTPTVGKDTVPMETADPGPDTATALDTSAETSVDTAISHDTASHDTASHDTAPFDTASPDTASPDPTDTASSDTALPEDPLRAEIMAHRDAWLADLGEPILECVVREDTRHPVFHGCIDWHSAVHGTWALQALGRLTGDTSYTDRVDTLLDADALDEELLDLERGALDAEIPYGFSWFLVLARERQRAGLEDLVPLADAVSERLSDHLFSLSDRQIENMLVSPAYGNLSWEVLNLWIHAEHTGDAALASDLEGFVRDAILPLSGTCPLEDDSTARNFFPPCLHLARLVVTVLPAGESEAWIEGKVPLDWDLEPLTEFPAAHLAGLNFSRSWDLFTLWEATGDAHLGELYLSHVSTHMDQPAYWAEDYSAYAHWVAQFGVYALALTDADTPVF